MKILAIFCLTFFLNLAPLADGDKDDCTYKGYPMMGKVRIVEQGEDVRIRIVDRPALYCYEWRIVDHGEDLRVRIVEQGEDLKIRFVERTP